jgi:hypothetical protein
LLTTSHRRIFNEKGPSVRVEGNPLFPRENGEMQRRDQNPQGVANGSWMAVDGKKGNNIGEMDEEG